MEMQTPFQEDRVLRAANTVRESKRTLAIQKSRLTKIPAGKTTPLSILQRSVTGLFEISPSEKWCFISKWESDDGKTFRWQLILPKTRVSKVLKELHGSPSGGHFGVMKTLQKFFNTGSHDSGSLYNCTPIKGETSILQFARDCEILAIDKTRTTALHPQSDGMVERFNRTNLNSHLSWYQVINRTGTRNCPFSCLPTGLPFTSSPAISHPRCSLDVIFVCLQIFSSVGHQMHPWRLRSISRNSLQARMEEMHHLARERIGMASEKMKARYDARATGHDFREGDKVWLWNPKRRKGLSAKLQTNWEGPYTVLKRLNDVVVRIQKSPHSKPKLIHYNRLAPYLGQD
ncbi:transposon Ty3-I Gag-Pol polyprotein [Trichonephila clavipes]|nr:transposon Ty3-I Gag-Pol polyprotein [Trichonephila clavipes]